jgi:hypothetical protein
MRDDETLALALKDSLFRLRGESTGQLADAATNRGCKEILQTNY